MLTEAQIEEAQQVFARIRQQLWDIEELAKYHGYWVHQAGNEFSCDALDDMHRYLESALEHMNTEYPRHKRKGEA